MPRKISFALTLRQFRDKSKTVTRRRGWNNLKANDILEGCEKVMGFKRGQKVVNLGLIQVVSVRGEPLKALTDSPEYGQAECVLEGFPDFTPLQFIEMFLATHKGCTQDEPINRIEFKYL